MGKNVYEKGAIHIDNSKKMVVTNADDVDVIRMMKEFFNDENCKDYVEPTKEENNDTKTD